MADSPVSTLSSHGSSEFMEDVKLEDREASLDLDNPDSATMPPSKRQKIGANSYRSTPQYDGQNDYGDISSDTSGSVPSSPLLGNGYVADDDQSEQVSECRWRNCRVGDLGNMDALVHHIHEDHIGQRQKRYACEWENCPRIDASHASGYALKAHMRSHTKAKPFYCALPECDKSFTRSDALAKHMRTVHETEALRPSDPVPRGHSQAQVKPQRIKLVLKGKIRGAQAEINNDPDESLFQDIDNATTAPVSLLKDTQLTEEELAMRPDQLYKLCRRQLHWSEEEGERLRKECEELEAQYKQEWQAKELVVANLIEAELAVASGNEAIANSIEEWQKLVDMKDELLPEVPLPMRGELPWYRLPFPNGDAEGGTMEP